MGDKPSGNLDKGTIFLFKLNSSTEPIIVKQNIGIIDYKKGEIKLNPINIISTVVNRNAPLIEVSANPLSNDVIGLQDLFLQLDVNNTTVDVIADNISSGNDISGTNYIVSSSYGVNKLVRGTAIITGSSDTTQTVSGTTSTTPSGTTPSTPTTGGGSPYTMSSPSSSSSSY